MSRNHYSLTLFFCIQKSRCPIQFNKKPKQTKGHLPMNYSITNPCLIKDPNITFSSFEPLETNDYLFYEATLTYTPECCPHCHTPYQHYNIVKNGLRKSKILLLDNQGKSVVLILKKQRYLCKDCRHSFTASTSIVDKHCFISKKVKQKIAMATAKIASEKEIAQLHHVSTSTVRRIIDHFAKTLEPKQLSLPSVLSFDEFKSTSSATGNMSFILVDPLRSEIVDIVENRQLAYLKAYFYRYPLHVRKQVKTIITDNNFSYIQFIPQLFPNAEIVLDRFHLVQALFRELNRIRIRTMNQFRTRNRPLYNKYKRYWRFIQMKQEKLQYSRLTAFKLFKEWTSTGRIVDYLLEQDPTFALHYHWIHECYDTIVNNDSDELTHLIDEILSSNADKGLKRVMRTFRKNLPYIKNTFKYKTLSNGVIEGINNKIKVIKRVAFGYRNYHHFKNRIMIIFKTKPINRPIKSKSVAYEEIKRLLQVS